MKRSIEYIEKVVCEERQINPTTLHVKVKSEKIAETRQIIMYFALMTGNTTTSTGGYFNLDHCTAIHARKRINDLMTYDKNLRHEIEILRPEIINPYEDIITIADKLEVLKRETWKLQQELNKIAI